jgi:hypothetical protein
MVGESQQENRYPDFRSERYFMLCLASNCSVRLVGRPKDSTPGNISHEV